MLTAAWKSDEAFLFFCSAREDLSVAPSPFFRCLPGNVEFEESGLAISAQITIRTSCPRVEASFESNKKRN